MKTFIFLLLLFSTSQAFSQVSKYKPDTIYYLADTLKTPVNDRLLKIYNESFSKNDKLDTIQSFSIGCPCLPNNYYPKFIRQIHRKTTLISKKQVENIKFTSLENLLSLIVKDYAQDFNRLHVVLVVEAIEKKYFLKEVSLLKYWGPVN